jgi:hypothetical protein
MLKSLAEIQMGGTTLLAPPESLSTNLLDNQHSLQALGDGAFKSFRELYDYSLTGDLCLVLNASVCSWPKDSLQRYGLNIMAQQIEEYFRLRNQSAILGDNSENRLIQYCQGLLDALLGSLSVANADYAVHLSSQELYLVVSGTLALLLALLLNYFALREFKSRIEDSKSLLQIIPPSVKQRH